MPTVDAAGAKLSFAVAGEGPGLLLIHGTGGEAATTWSELTPVLSESWTLVMPDLPGSGETVDGGGPLELDDLAQQGAAAAEAAGLERYSVLGFSLGAAVAASLAASRPEQVEALVLVGGPVEGKKARAHLQFDLWRDLHQREPELFARLWMLSGFSPGFVNQIPVAGLDLATTFPVAPGVGRQCELSKELELDGVLGEIRARTLVLVGREDWIAPPAFVREAAAKISGSSYEELEGGHFTILENPAALLERVVDFLRTPRDRVGKGS